MNTMLKPMMAMTQFAPLLPMGIVAITALVVMILVALVRNYRLTVMVSALGLFLALLSSVLQLAGVLPVGAVDGFFYIDGFAQVNSMVISFVALACVLLSYEYFNRLSYNKEELYLLMLLSTLGAMMMVAAQHFASFFVALELLSVPIYGMLSYTFLKEKSLESGIKYLVLSAVASATLLMGMALIFAGMGTLHFVAIERAMMAGMDIGPLLIVGAVLMVAAIGFKLSLAPFHAWAADVYQGAPVPITAFLASVAKVAAVALAMRFLIGSAVPALIAVDGVLSALIILSVLVGNLLALYQDNLRRLLAYSSIAHMGYVMMALVAVGETADTISTMYMMIYALTAVGAFGVMSLLSGTQGSSDDMSAYRGLFWRRPVLTAVMMMMLLSMAGMPLTAGFMTKMQIMLTVVQGGRFGLAAMLIVGSAIGLYYYLKVILIMFKRPVHDNTIDVPDNWRSGVGGMVVIVVAAMLFVWGVLPNSLYRLASLAMLG